MNAPSPDPTLPPELFQRIDPLCEAFETAWRAGKRPSLSEFLAGLDEPARSALLRELLLLEIEYRQKAGQQPRAEEYLNQLPSGDAALIREVFGESPTLHSEVFSLTHSSRNTGQKVTKKSPGGSAPSKPPPAAIGLDKFIDSLTGCGLMSRDELDAYLETFSDEDRPRDGRQLAEALYYAKKLTRFQVQAVYQGKTRGLVIGNYVVLDRLGKGGMGQVYKAWHRKMDRVVAIKLLPTQSTKSDESVKRFRREVKVAAKLSHPNIVTAYDADEYQGAHFLVMEYVEGQDLARVVQQHGPLPVSQAVNCILQTAKGLDYAHRQGIIHRDIKPHNLLLDVQGAVKILDMGLARIEENVGAATGPGDEGLTSNGQVMGTLDYMSPEQALNTKTADARADIYSLGCTLYYLLAGHPPFGGDSLAQKILAHRQEPIPTIRAVRPDVPEEIDRLLGRMLAKRPDERPATATEIIQALQPYTGPAELSELIHQTEDSRETTQSPLTESATAVDDPLSSFLMQTRDRQPAVQPAGRGDIRWPMTLLALTAGAAALLGVILFVTTDRGTLVIKTHDDNVQVLVTQDGREVTILDTKTNQSVKLHSGQYEVKLADGKKGLTLSTDHFTLRRGEKVVVEVLRRPGPPEVTAENVRGGLPGAGEPTPEPGTFDARHLTPSPTDNTNPSPEDYDQAVAKWILTEIGGKVTVAASGRRHTVKNARELPRESFRLLTVNLRVIHRVTDESLKRLKGLKSLEWLNIGNTSVTDAGLEHLKGLESLFRLGVSRTAVTNDGLKAICALKHLRILSLADTRVNDSGLAHLQDLPDLQILGLQGAAVTDAGMEHLPRCRSLRSLNLNRTKITDTALAQLTGFKELRCLFLGSTQVTDAGLEHLAKMPWLEELGLDCRGVTDAGLEKLQGLQSLRKLIILNPSVTDAGLRRLRVFPDLSILFLSGAFSDDAVEHLKELRSLNRLHLVRTGITSQGVKTLKSALPHCRIRTPRFIEEEDEVE
ncbi:MAG: protein kinase [Pirellulales bacterium]|nr:protein kinase [Pirellulales bacterium]